MGSMGLNPILGSLGRGIGLKLNMTFQYIVSFERYMF